MCVRYLRMIWVVALAAVGLGVGWLGVSGQEFEPGAVGDVFPVTAGPLAPYDLAAEEVISHTAVIEDFGGRSGLYTDMEVISGRPAIAFYNFSKGRLQYMRAEDADGDSWPVPSGVYQENASTSFIVLRMVNGKPAMVFWDNTNQVMVYMQAADSTGSSWQPPVVIDNPVRVETIDLEIINGRPAVAYGASPTFSTFELRYARANDVDGGSWGTPQTLDNSQPRIGLFPQLEIVAGLPAIAYQDLTQGLLKFMRAQDLDGVSWGAALTVESTGTPVSWPSMKIIGGAPAIAYRYSSGATSNLRYVRAAAADGSSWGTPLDLGQLGSITTYGLVLAEIDTRPALVYSAGSNTFYHRANDGVGSSWPAPTPVFTTTSFADSLAFFSLEEVNGRPAIGARNDKRETVIYQRAADSSGDVWGEFERLDGGYSGFANDLALVNGRPAVSFAQGFGGGLRYARAGDHFGVVWGAGQTVDPEPGTGENSRLLIANNRPAIAYLNSNDGLRYVRAADIDGNSWLSPTQLITSGVSVPDAAVVDGVPAVAYYDYIAGEVRLIRALDGNGDSWGSPVLVSAVGEPDTEGRTLLLLVFNGKPAVAFVDGNDDKLKLILASDPQGNSWGAPIEIDSDIEGYEIGFDIHQDRLSFVYYTSGVTFDYILNYIRADNASGTSWGTPVEVLQLDRARNAPFLGWLNGAPVIMYAQRYTAVSSASQTGSGWEMVRAVDAAGSSWGSSVQLLPETGDGSFLALGPQAFGFTDGDESLNYLGYRVQNRYDLAVVRSGSGLGSVTSSPAGVDCGLTCTASFLEGTMVTLTAAPDEGSLFAGWEGSCTGMGGCVVTLDQARSVTAVFEEKPPTLYLPLQVRP